MTNRLAAVRTASFKVWRQAKRRPGKEKFLDIPQILQIIVITQALNAEHRPDEVVCVFLGFKQRTGALEREILNI